MKRSESLLVVLLVLPWINPFAFSPAPWVVQSLLTALALAALLLLRLPDGQDAGRVLLRVQAWGWLWAALVSAVVGLIQYFDAGPAFAPWVRANLPGQVFANLGQRNHFATLSLMGLLALVWLDSGPAGQQSAWRKSVATLAALLLGVGTGMSASRTGLLQCGVIAVLLFVVWRSSRPVTSPRLLLAAALGFAVATFVLPWLAGLALAEGGFVGRLLAPQPQACYSRRVLWSNMLYLIGQSPLTGWGWGDLLYTHFTTLYPGMRFCDLLDNAHNLPLQLAVEFGLPAALLMCGYGLLLLWRARPWAEQDSGRQLVWGVLAVIGLHSLLEYPLWYAPFQLAAGGSLVVLWLTRPGAELAAQSDPGRTGGRAVRWAAAASVLAAAAFTAVQFASVVAYFPSSAKPLPPFAEGQMQSVPRPLLFGHWVDFAEVVNTPVTERNAPRMLALSEKMLHISISPPVIETLVRSAVLLKRYDMALFYLDRYKAFFPEEHAAWVLRNEKR